MRLSNNYSLNVRNIIIAVCLAFCALNNALAQTPDDKRIWTTVGSAGTVDETAAGKVFFDRSVVQMGRPLVSQSAARELAAIPSQTQSAVIRYNVTPVDGLFFPMQLCQPGRECSGAQLELRYLATGLNAQVVAKLIEVNLATGVETVRLTFDSKAFAAANSYQVHGASDCSPRWRFDFERKAYYIEVTLTSSSVVSGSAAGMQMIKINNFKCGVS